MCEFKYCRGTGTCFLSKTSPCPGFEAANAPEAEAPRAKSRTRSVGLRYEGFLDHDELMTVLEMEPVEKPAEPPKKLADVMSAAPRFIRRFTSRQTDAA